MKAKRFLFSAFFVLMLHFSTPVNAQQGSGSSLFREYPVSGNTPQFGLQAGTMFTTGFRGASMFTQSMAPSMNWDISRRFSLEMGTILSTSTMHGSNAFFPFTPHMAGGESMDVLKGNRLFSSTFYASGAYQVNPRLTLVGSTWMDYNNFPEMGMNPQALTMNPRGAMFGFDYRITENFSFGAEVNFSKGMNPFNPFYNPYMGPYNRHNPVFHSPAPFHRGSRW